MTLGLKFWVKDDLNQGIGPSFLIFGSQFDVYLDFFLPNLGYSA